MPVMHYPLATIHSPIALLPDEIRLLLLVAVNVFVFVVAYRFVRRATSQDWIGCTLDAFLIHYLVQYLSVCVPGLMGILGAETMLIVATLLVCAIWFYRGVGASPTSVAERNHVGEAPTPRIENLTVIACLLFIAGYFLALLYALGGASLVGDDALTYHLPAAGFWLQTHRIGLYNTWFFNPANTYSPLAGSTFLAWLIAPIGADQLANFAQMPALIFIFFGIVQIARALGVRPAIAALAATGALLSRPFISEAILVKDDVFLAAFFLAVVAGCARDRLADRLGPWRIGIALGLVFATKYTALLTAPLFLFLIDAPIRARWRWRDGLIAATCGLVVAGPWYLRNWILTGNPLYPVPISIGSLQVFAGMFIPARSTEMRTIAGAWKALTHGFHSPSPALVIALLILWLTTAVLNLRAMAKDALLRLCVLGPLIGLAIFFGLSHAALIRYAYPSLLLLFICSTLVFRNWLWPLTLGLVIVIECMSIWGGFEDKEVLGGFLLGAAGVVVAGLLIIFFLVPQMRNARARAIVWSIIGLAAACWVFVFWHAILLGARQSWFASMQTPYPDKWEMWKYIDDNVPADAPIAYTNLVFTRPLMNFDYSRRVVYVPTCAGLRNYSDLVNSRTVVADEQIRGFVANLLTENPDHDLWLRNLLASNAQYLLVGKQSVLKNPPEKAFADVDSQHFSRMREDDSGTLYQIRR
jgi:hypothetical protein